MSDFTVVSDTNPIYAEIERLKRERDALAECLAGIDAIMPEHGNEPLLQGLIDDARAAIAQVRK